MIVERKGKFIVKTADGTKTLGTHPTKEAAERQLRAIEANKHKRVR